MIEDYYIKQMKLKERQNELNKIKEIKEIERQQKINENRLHIIKTKENNDLLLAARINGIINKINNKDRITDKIMMLKRQEYEEQLENAYANLMIRNDRIRRLERVNNMKIEEKRKLINDKYNRIQNMKEQQMMINEKKEK